MIYYNEIDPYCVQWLQNLMRNGLIPFGVVDSRPIQEVKGEDLIGFTQCHFFAGIGGWAYALQLAGWGDESVWTGSCPCQPFSIAGRRRGTADERHLWPEFYRLLSECKPSICFGEQVASKDGREWLSEVRVDLEALGYAVGAADLCAAGVGAQHVRQRLYYMAHAICQGLAGSMQKWTGLCGITGQASTQRCYNSIFEGLFNVSDPANIEIVDGVSRPVGIMRGFGNAIVPQVAAEFIRACMECIPKP
jgi:DNA (cytosine-5)-methyltransferase 1